MARYTLLCVYTKMRRLNRSVSYQKKKKKKAGKGIIENHQGVQPYFHTLPLFIHI